MSKNTETARQTADRLSKWARRGWAFDESEAGSDAACVRWWLYQADYYYRVAKTESDR